MRLKDKPRFSNGCALNWHLIFRSFFGFNISESRPLEWSMRSVGEAEGLDGRDSTSTQRPNNASVHILIPLLLYNIFQVYGLVAETTIQASATGLASWQPRPLDLELPDRGCQPRAEQISKKVVSFSGHPSLALSLLDMHPRVQDRHSAAGSIL